MLTLAVLPLLTSCLTYLSLVSAWPTIPVDDPYETKVWNTSELVSNLIQMTQGRSIPFAFKDLEGQYVEVPDAAWGYGTYNLGPVHRYRPYEPYVFDESKYILILCKSIHMTDYCFYAGENPKLAVEQTLNGEKPLFPFLKPKPEDWAGRVMSAVLIGRDVRHCAAVGFTGSDYQGDARCIVRNEVELNSVSKAYTRSFLVLRGAKVTADKDLVEPDRVFYSCRVEYDYGGCSYVPYKSWP